MNIRIIIRHKAINLKRQFSEEKNMKGGNNMNKYFQHMKANMVVAARAFCLTAFHFIHGVIPCRWTEHEYWGIYPKKKY